MRTSFINVYQYDATGPRERIFGRGREDTTKWIAAPTEEQADAAATKRGWHKAGGCIFPNWTFNPKQLKQAGCDVIVRPK